MRSWRRAWGERRRADAAARRQHAIDLLLAAWASGDERALVGVLSADATMLVDGGAVVPPVQRTAHGADAVASALVHALAGCPGATLAARDVNGEAGVVATTAGRVVAVVTAHLRGRVFDRLWAVADAEKLRHWNTRGSD